MNKFAAFCIDVLALAIFAFAARVAHQSDSMPLTFMGFLSTWWPFLVGVAIGWAIILLAKLEPSKLAPAGVIIWIVTVATGLCIWGIRNSAFPHWSFMLVAGSMSALLLLGWRLIARSLRGRGSSAHL